jgi:hypothetical protein
VRRLGGAVVVVVRVVMPRFRVGVQRLGGGEGQVPEEREDAGDERDAGVAAERLGWSGTGVHVRLRCN